jgi:hypothetical protein
MRQATATFFAASLTWLTTLVGAQTMTRPDAGLEASGRARVAGPMASTALSPAELVAALREAPEATGRPEFPPIPQAPTIETDWGREFFERHPVLRHPDGGNSARYGRELAARLTSDELRALAPRQVAGCWYSRCPRCRKGGESNVAAHWQWSETRPDELVCRHCKTTFPDDRYPQDQTRTYLNPVGERIEIAFHKAADGEEHFLGALLDTLKDAFCRQSLIHLGYAYHETGGEDMAAAALAIFRGYAESMPHWLTYGAEGWGAPRQRRGYLSTGGPYMRNGVKHAKRDPYSWEEGRGPYTSWWFRSMPTELYRAYDLIYKSTHFDNARSPDGTQPLRFWIENRIFDEHAQYLLSYPWEAQIQNNLPLHISDLTKVAMVCGRPQYARFARDWCSLVFYHYESHHDMVTHEGPGYHNTWIGHGRPTYEALGRYDDPPGYRDEHGVSLVGLDPRERPAKRRQFWGTSMMHFPDGSSYPIGDSSRGKQGSMPFPLQRSVNRIAPGFGLTVLGDGTLQDNNQVQAILSWNGGTHSHSHEDVQNLLLFANGRELFSDVGGIWDARMTSAHNTVAIDGKDNGRRIEPAGSLELFTPNLPGLAITRVEAKMAAYKEGCNRYRRTLVHNTVDLDHVYVLDIFEVQGGSKHEYFLQGSAEKEHPQTGSTSLALTEYPQPPPENPEAVKGWAGFSNLRSAPMTHSGHVDFRFADQPTLGTRTHFQAVPTTQLILGDAINFRFATAHAYRSNKRSQMPTDKTVPKLILRREGAAGLRSVYVLVHEVLDGKSVVRSITHSTTANGLLAVTVDVGDRQDHYAISLEGAGTLECGPLTADGLFAAAVVQGDACDLWLAGGTRASCNGRTLTAPHAMWTGSVAQVKRMENGAPRDAYLTDAPLPVGSSLANEMVMLEFVGEDGNSLFTLSSEIAEVLADGDRRWVTIRQDAGVVQNGDGTWEEIFYPRRKAANCRLKVIASATTVPRLHWAPSRPRYDAYDTNDFVALNGGEALVVETDRPATVTVSGDLTAQGRGRLELPVNRDARVVLTADNPGGAMEPRAEVARFVTRRPAANVTPATLRPGIIWRRYRERADLKPLPELKQMDEGTAETISDFRDLRRNQTMAFSGFLRVPRAGTYRFYSRQAGGAKLSIGGLAVLNAPNFERDEEFHADIALEAGLHRLSYQFGHNRETGEFTLRWAGPGIAKQPIPAAALFHAPPNAYGRNVFEESVSPASKLLHPGVLQSAAMLGALKKSLAGKDPERLKLWGQMLASPRGRIDKTDWQPGKVVTQDRLSWTVGMSAAGAIRYVLDWVMTGNREAEANAISILNTWAACEAFEKKADDGLGHHRLVGGITLGSMANAAEMLMASGTSWPEAEQERFKATWRRIFLPIVTENRPNHFNGNWDLACAWSILASAVMLDDRELFDKEITYLKEGKTNARFSIYLLPSGQCQETGRDQVHAQMGLYFASLCAQIAWNQGIDLYEGEGYSLGRSYEYLAMYNLGEDRVPYRIYNEAVGRSSRHQSPVPSAKCRGQFAKHYEMIYHHYRDYRGTELPHVRRVLAKHTRPETPSPNTQIFSTLCFWNLDLRDDAACRRAGPADVSVALVGAKKPGAK